MLEWFQEKYFSGISSDKVYFTCVKQDYDVSTSLIYTTLITSEIKFFEKE